MNLEQAATKALSDVKNLITEFGAGHKQFSTLEEQIKKVAEQLHADWPHALEKAKHVLEDLKRQKHDLDDEARHANQILIGLSQKINEMHHEALDALHATRAGIHDLEQHVHGLEPELGSAFTHAEETGHQLRDGANHIKDEFHHVATDVHHYMQNDVVNDIKHYETEVNDHSHDYHEHVADSVLPETEHKHEEVHNHLDEQHNQFEDTLHRLHDQKHEAATQSLSECHDKHNEIFEDFEQIGQQVHGIMDGLGKAVEAGGTAIHEGQEVIGAAVDSTSIGMKLIIDILSDLMDLFKRFSFISF